MKNIYKYLLSLIVLTSLLTAVNISTTESMYTQAESVKVNIEGTLSGNKDWVGLYRAGASSDWKNVVAWSWVNGNKNNLSMDSIRDKTSNDLLLSDGGHYEVRLFFNNSYKVEASEKFYVKQTYPALFVTYPEINIGDKQTVLVNTPLSGDKDWVGIYPKGSDNSWDNVIAWNWATYGDVSLNKIKKEMPAGEYDIRLFFHNSFDEEKSTNFYVIDEQNKLSTTKPTYTEYEKIVVNLKNLAKDNKNWVGIYPKDASNDWSNMVTWERPLGKTTLSLDGVEAGEYEARLFYSSAFKLLAKTGFSVKANENNYIYGSEGPYIKDVELIQKKDYFAYYPKNNTKDAPLVLISGYRSLNGYKGLMKYLASQGCYVVAHADRKKEEGWSDSVPKIQHFEKAISDVKELGVDTSRLITMGSSAGGMVSYKIMEYFKKKGYGAKKSFIVDIIGYYASGMTKNDLSKLESDSLIFLLGGNTGMNKYSDGSDASEDPRTLLSLSKLLNPNMKKSFIVIDDEHHSYAGGKYEDIIKKKHLLEPIDAMLKYEFFNDDGRYNNAESILFDNYTKTVEEVYNATMVKVGNKLPLQIGYDSPCVNPWKTSNEQFDPEENPFGKPFEATIDYCNDHGLQ